MKRILLTLASALVLSPYVFAGIEENSPAADAGATVICGNARFTVLTDRLVRMEWSEDAVFEDRASLAVINRKLPVPQYNARRNGEGVQIRTDALVVDYKGGRFDSDNLSVSFKMNGKTVHWHPGLKDEGNLKGTVRTLDGIDGRFDRNTLRHHSPYGPYRVEMEDGILSKDGWAIVDESCRHLLEKDGSDWEAWVAERPAGDRIDWYIFAYGHDYTAALRDFTKIAGRIPMPPKYTFGYWWSRYWIYTDVELLQIAGELRGYEVPADVFVIDMDWHLTWKEMQRRLGPDEFGESRGWTGYSWNHDLIPDPEGLLSNLHAMDFKTSLNLHPASGIRPYEDCYGDFVKDYLSRTDDYDGPPDYIYTDEDYVFKGTDKSFAKKGYRAAVPYRMSQQAWADAYFNSVIHPLEHQGVDFWWIDWQQWVESRYVGGLNNTFWINYAFFNDKVRRSASEGRYADRPFIYHRWGGLGSHRYQLGFSGDTYDEWGVLEMLPHFTATASNVGYGYWGHDIGGHFQKSGHYTDPEMFTRWIQYGVFTPIFKTHSSESEYLERKIWAYPTHYEYMKAAIELRYALSPYIYNAARQAYDTGVSICRPLYYYYPEDERAYTRDQEYMFGDQILATVLCQPLDPESGKTERKMWFPAGNDWYDMARHCIHKGGSEKTLYYSIDENPWYVKSGAIIPLAGEGIQNLQQADNRLRILIVPGAGKSSCLHYEDDGKSQAYTDEYATTLIEKTLNGRNMTVTVNPRQGTYRNAPATRAVSIVLEGVKAASATLDGKELETVCKEGAVSIILPETSVTTRSAVKIRLGR